MVVRKVTREAFSLTEIMVAVAVLAACFIPVLTHSQSTVKETEESQEQVLARHFLIDMVERFRGSGLGELQRLPATEPSVALGNDPDIIKQDAVLSDRERVAAELNAKAAAGTVDAGQKSFNRYVDAAAQMKFTRVAWFVENARGPGMHELHCKVRWLSKNSKGEKSIQVAKVLSP